MECNDSGYGFSTPSIVISSTDRLWEGVTLTPDRFNLRLRSDWPHANGCRSPEFVLRLLVRAATSMGAGEAVQTSSTEVRCYQGVCTNGDGCHEGEVRLRTKSRIPSRPCPPAQQQAVSKPWVLCQMEI